MDIPFQCLIIIGNNMAGIPATAAVSRSASGHQLKQILKENIEELKDVKATDLDLRWVNVSLTNYLEQLADLDLKRCPEVSSSTPISSLASSENCVHVVVLLSGFLHLNCALLNAGEIDWDQIFAVSIASRLRLNNLKYVVKKNNSILQGNPVFKFTLFSVSISKDPNARDGRYQAVDLGQPIQQTEQLSTVFPSFKLGRIQLVIRLLIVETTLNDEQRGEGRNEISILHNRFQKLVSCISGALPPSESAKPISYPKSQLAYSIHDGRYKEGRPRTNVAPPVQLFHPTFGHFLDDIKSTDPIPNNIMRGTTEYMKAASAIYDSERKRAMALNPILCKILGVNIQSIIQTDKTNADGTVEMMLDVGHLIIFLEEDKNEIGEGHSDPATQAGLSAARTWAQPKFKMFRDVTNCPTFLVATAGPWITILGAILTDGFIVQRLTDYMWVALDSAANEQHISRVARTFYSLNKGLTRLASYYQGILPPNSLPADTRYFPSITAFPSGDRLIYFKYMGFLEDEPDCMTLRAQTFTQPPQTIVVKFVERYGAVAHRLLSSYGYAPRLLYCGSPHIEDGDPSYASLFMVVMGFVEGKTVAKSKMSKEAAKTIHLKVELALNLLHT